MKKSFLLLPLTALVLTACNSSTETTSEAEAPVAVSSAYDLQTEVQSTSMPSSMSGTSTTYSQPQPIPSQPVTQPTYSQPTYSQPTYSQPSVQSSSSGEFYIPRDSAGKPIYSQIAKGSYTGSSYTVQQGDTMYLIGYISGKGADEVARLNNLTAPYQLRVGQTLRLQ